MHELETGRRKSLPGTEGAWHLFWSPDGRSILKDEFEPGSGVRTVHVYSARFSPDSKWVAYSSSETGRFEVYVMRAEDGRSKLRLSSEGGVHPVWRSDGRELYYWGGADLVGPLMGVELEPVAEGFRASAARADIHSARRWTVRQPEQLRRGPGR